MQTNEMIKSNIEQGLTTLGIEFGSTRIKAVLINTDHEPIAVGAYDWENSLIDGIWTYSEEEIWAGLQGCYKNLVEEVKAKLLHQELIKLGVEIYDEMRKDLEVDGDSKIFVKPPPIEIDFKRIKRRINK